MARTTPPAFRSAAADHRPGRGRRAPHRYGSRHRPAHPARTDRRSGSSRTKVPFRHPSTGVPSITRRAASPPSGRSPPSRGAGPVRGRTYLRVSPGPRGRTASGRRSGDRGDH
ncbi:hypothetical protein E1284_14680 [Actinomadura bangladeshensis]|uniref:Uncharacterized protein n=1 Tax=Actinomadura bangladeshensis TaxID=453573 RepID=A0A4R4P4M5_9ACTN|nr:hypothetical protein E1284_14680 [Actinomadura bangladeshensis]